MSVLSYDRESGELRESTVIGVVDTMTDEIMSVRLPSGVEIKSTPDHPYYSPRTGHLMSLDPASTISDYDLGDSFGVHEMADVEQVQLPDGSVVDATVSLVKTDSPTPVRTLQLDSDHWFHVPALVHNKVRP